MKSIPVVGMVGAYERDNFGDLLFLERTRAFLGGAELEPLALSPFRGVLEQLTSQPTPAFVDAVNDSLLDVIWVVGGEVGGVLVHAAYKMLDPQSQDATFSQSNRFVRRSIIRARSGLEVTDFAYLPRPSRYQHLHAAPFIINSSGLSGIAKLRGNVRAEAIGSLHDADFVSVREHASSHLLTELGVKHRLAPDLVHTLRFDYPDFVNRDFRNDARARRVAVVQMSAATLGSAGVDELIAFLGTSEALRGCELRLLAAGLAPSHDSLEMYKSVVAGVNQDYPTVSIAISPASSAMEKVREIASSSIMIGTSLHAMIVSMAFDVPHVGLYLEKIGRYARAWDDRMPTEVALADANAAVEFALASELGAVSSGLGEDLAKQAQSNMEAAIAVARTGDSEEANRSRALDRNARGLRLMRESKAPSRRASTLLRSMVRPLS